MDDVHPKMRFSLTPPASKAIFSSSIKLGTKWNRESGAVSKCEYQNGNNINNNNESTTNCDINCDKDTMQREEDKSNSNKPMAGNAGNAGEAESTSDYKQWLHAMKLVARLPGGIPPEFRRKLWLSLADKYLKAKNVDWTKEEEKCFCEKWREDDEELGIQIVKDLHRTGSTLCTGPAGDINQAKLKRILLGYARYHPQVGYCQGFNMLGALILQVMDKEEIESMKVMIYLVEGILPPGYFCGSMGGLQADMAVFRELMQTKLPRLARHLQKLQGPIENAFEPPLTNVFTMQWFLTMFCTCLPMSCVLRVWDLVLIEGSDVLLRTALALWGLLEDRVLSTRSADDFYGKMGSFSSELLNGHLIDSNGLIEKVVQLGPIQDIQKLRDKHLNSMTPLKNRQGLNLYYDDDEVDMDEDSRLAVATVWGLPWGRRGSQGQAANAIAKQATESKDRIALDISLLKKQYDRLRERQKQAHIILTTACSAARQSAGSTTYSTPLPVNQLLSGRPAIVTNKGRRTGPPSGAVPPARKPSLPAVLQDKPLEKHLRRGETLQWRDTSETKRRRDSLTWREIKAERAALSTSDSAEGIKSQKIRTKRLGKSDSSSYSEESGDEVIEKAGSSSDTSLCDDDNQELGSNRHFPALRSNTLKASKLLTRQKSLVSDYTNRQRPKSWAPSNSDIPFVLMTTDSPSNSADEGPVPTNEYMQLPNEEDEDEEEGENSATESDQNQFTKDHDLPWSTSRYSPLKEDIPLSDIQALSKHSDLHTAPISLITPLRSASTIESPPVATTHLMDSTNSLGSEDGEECDETKDFGVSDEGVTNQYFERVNGTERPTKLDLFYSLNEEASICDAYKVVAKEDAEDNQFKNNKNRCMDLLVDYSEKSSAACIAEAKTEISNTLQKNELTIKPELVSMSSAASKRRNPRRLTLTRSSTMEIEKRYQALEKRLSMEASCKYKIPAVEKDTDFDLAAREESHIATEKPAYEPQISDETHVLQDEEKAMASTIVSFLQRKPKIPSTADLELRFANIVLDRVSKVSTMSDSEGSKNTQKTPTSPKEPAGRSSINAGPTKDADKGQARAKDSSVKNEAESTKEGIDTEEEASTEGDRKGHPLKTAKSNNVKAPDNTTAIKENSLQRKKEPPDNKTDNEPTTKDSSAKQDAKERISEIRDEVNKFTENSDIKKDKNTAKLQNPTSDKDQTSISTKQQQENGEHKKSHTKAESIQKNTSDTKKNNATPQDGSHNDTAKKEAVKKSPPSTEELEKRFNALEKQMSVSKNESDLEEDDREPAAEKPQSADQNNENAYKSPEKVVKPSNESTNMANQVLNAMKSSTSRRASEPPSTEDLEKRFEVLKRRMSSKAFETNLNRRKASENFDDAGQEFQDTSARENARAGLKESPPSTDSLEERFHKLQRTGETAKSVKSDENPVSEEGQSKVKESLRAKIHRATESSTANNDGLSCIVQMAVEARKAAESPSQEKIVLGDVAQRAVKASKDTQSPLTSKESFSGIMHKAVEAHKAAAETPTPVKETFSDIMHMAVKANKAAETPTSVKETFSGIMQKAVDAHKTAAELPTPVKETFSDIMHMAVKANKAAETPTSVKETFSGIMQKAVDAHKTAAELPTPVKETFSDIMHMAVKANKAAETPTSVKETFSGIMQKAVEANKTAAELPTPVRETFSDIMHMAVKAHKAVETPTSRKESLSGIAQMAVDARKNTKTPIREKDNLADIAQKAVKTHKSAETPTANKDSLSDVVQMAIDARKSTGTPTKDRDNLADVAQRAIKTQKVSTTSKGGFGDIAEMAIEASKNQESTSKAKDNLSDNGSPAVKSSRPEGTPTKSKENFSDIMQMAVKAQRNLDTHTKSKDSLSGIVQMAVEAQRTTMESSEEGMTDDSADQIPDPKMHLKDTDKPESRSALIEELQSKMSASADGESIKPSSINPNRKTPQHTPILRKSNTDETSETHATTAYSKSGKNEQFHSQNRKMVRRFSDLPSRADLENRLLFLEEQLSKNLLQQRRASDSEVASHRRDNDARTPGSLRYAGKLEGRVRELEKQLSGTSKSAKPIDNLHIGTSRIPLEITADSVDATSRELVRYTHYGEIDEPDSHNPINISINIHMTLNKDNLDASGTQSMSRAEEINKRLLILEQQLNASKINIASSASIPQELCESAKSPTSERRPSEMDENRIKNIVHAPAECQIEEGDTINTLCEETKTDQLTSDLPSEKDINTEAIKESSAPKIESMEAIVEPVEQSAGESAATAVKEEQITAKERKKLESIAKAEELDRRLQILEEHMKNSPPSAAYEHMHREALAAPPTKDNDIDVDHTKKIAQSIDTEDTKLQEKVSEEPTKASEKNVSNANIASANVASTSEAKLNVANANVAAAGGNEVLLTKNNDKVEPDLDHTDKTVSEEGHRVSGAPKASDESKVGKSPNENVAKERSNDVPMETLDITQMVPVEVNKKTLVLVLDNEPKAVKVRRLTRANTEELEGLFQALEKQLIERGQIKHEDIAKAIEQEKIKSQRIEDKSAQEMSDLSKEIEEFSKSCDAEKTPTKKKPKEADDFDWGINPVKHHLKKRTVHLPSTKELESRFRSLERQIKLLEDVEKIDVEQRLTEIDRKLKLQYSLSHETDLVRFLDLCEGKGLDDTPPPMEQLPPDRTESHEHCCDHTRTKTMKMHQSPSRVKKMEAPVPSASCGSAEHCCERMRCKNAVKRHQSPGRVQEMEAPLPTMLSRNADLKKTKQKSTEKKREPIHPLEMLLDPSPDERDIPTTGELEHRMRVLEENRDMSSPSSRKSHSKSPTKSQTYIEIPDSPSPTDRGLPTAEQLEARLVALEKEKKFDFKMQKDYKQFNQKLKDIISPSLSFEEFKAARSSSSEAASRNLHRSPSPRAAGCAGSDASCPKVIRFHEDEHQRPKSRNDNDSMVSKPNNVLQILEENANMIQRLLQKPIADTQYSSSAPTHCSVHEGLGVMGIRLMRETSPLRRKGTHTGVPLRTGENINDQLTSIKNTIKSIDSLCEEKPYKRERCQQYIDSLFTDSTYFGSKKSSLDDLTARHLSRSTSREYGPSIRISEHSPAFTRSIGSAESIRSSSPLRPITPLQYHSNRDLRREISPRRRRDEEREENESRVRRDNLMPNIHNYNHSPLSHSLTKFHKVDSQLISNDVDVIDVERLSSNETKSIRVNNTNTSTTANTTIIPHTNAVPTNDTTFKGSILDRPISPYRQLGLSRSNTPVYTPAKLEIRHTTVTSTFYDRVLAEKQLEKKHATTANASKSPLLELPIKSSFQSDRSPTTLASPDSALLTLAGHNSATGNYPSYQSDILANTPSPVIAKDTLAESQITFIAPKT